MAWYERGKVVIHQCRECGQQYVYGEWIYNTCCIDDYHAQHQETNALPWRQRLWQRGHGWALQLSAWLAGAAERFPRIW